jgi:hypothetical protein
MCNEFNCKKYAAVLYNVLSVVIAIIEISILDASKNDDMSCAYEVRANIGIMIAVRFLLVAYMTYQFSRISYQEWYNNTHTKRIIIRNNRPYRVLKYRIPNYNYYLHLLHLLWIWTLVNSYGLSYECRKDFIDNHRAVLNIVDAEGIFALTLIGIIALSAACYLCSKYWCVTYDSPSVDQLDVIYEDELNVEGGECHGETNM